MAKPKATLPPIEEQKVNEVSLKHLVNTPISNTIFGYHLERSNLATLSKAIRQVRQSESPSRGKLKRLEGKFRKLGGDLSTLDQNPSAESSGAQNGAESSPEQEQIIRFTTAPQDFDVSGTETVEWLDWYTQSGERYRKVGISADELEWQNDRYVSGFHAIFDAAGFEALISSGVLVTIDEESEGALSPEPTEVEAADVKPEAEPELKPEAAPEAEPETEPEAAEAETSDVKPEPETAPKPKAAKGKKGKSTPESQPEPEPEPIAVAPEQGFKFGCAQEHLAAHLPVLARLLSSSFTVQIFYCVLVTVDRKRSKLTLLGYNLKIAYQVEIDADVEVEGCFCLPASLLNELVARLPAEAITFEHDLENDGVTITSSSGKHQLKGLPPDEFPALPNITGKAVRASSTMMLSAINNTLFSASTDATKQVLCGVRFTFGIRPDVTDDDPTKTFWIEAVSTDGHRLSYFTDNLPMQTEGVSLTIPGGGLIELQRLLKDAKTLTMQFEGEQAVVGSLLSYSHIKFEMSNGNLLICRLLDGQYPEYKQLIPQMFSHIATVKRSTLLYSLERVALFTKNERAVRLTFEKGEVQLNADSESGLGDEAVPVSLKGGRIQIAFNVFYLIETLKIIPTQEVTIEMNTSTSPAVIRPVFTSETNTKTFLSLVMPVQIRGDS